MNHRWRKGIQITLSILVASLVFLSLPRECGTNGANEAQEATLASTYVFSEHLASDRSENYEVTFTSEYSTDRGTVLLLFRDYKFDTAGWGSVTADEKLPIFETIRGIEVTLWETDSGRAVFSGTAIEDGELSVYNTEHYGVVSVGGSISLAGNKQYTARILIPKRIDPSTKYHSFRFTVGVRQRPWM